MTLKNFRQNICFNFIFILFYFVNIQLSYAGNSDDEDSSDEHKIRIVVNEKKEIIGYGGDWSTNNNPTSVTQQPESNSNSHVIITNKPITPVEMAFRDAMFGPRHTPTEYLNISISVPHNIKNLVETDQKTILEKQEKIRSRFNQCNENIEKKLQNELSYLETLSELKNNITENLSKFDKKKAFELRRAITRWSMSYSGSEMAGVICSIENIQTAVENYENTISKIDPSVDFQYAPIRADIFKLANQNLLAGLDWITESAKYLPNDKSSSHESKESGDFATEIGALLVDFATSITPGVSTGRDIYEVFTGKDLLDGHELDISERALAGICVASLGTGSFIKGSLKSLEKLAHFIKSQSKISVVESTLVDTLKMSHHIVDSAAKNVPASWGHWSDLKKVQLGQKEYAEVGNLLYKQHAIERMAPNGLIQQGNNIYSRGVPTIVVEHAVNHGIKNPGQYANTVEHVFENVTVITDGAHKIVHTVIKKGH
jgi:hypothetical protein